MVIGSERQLEEVLWLKLLVWKYMFSHNETKQKTFFCLRKQVENRRRESDTIFEVGKQTVKGNFPHGTEKSKS